MKALAIRILTITIFVPCVYSDEGFYVAPHLVAKKIKIDEDFLIPGFDDSENLYGYGVIAGYKTPFNLLFELGYEASENLSALGSTFDNYELTQLKLGVGIEIPISERVSIVPKLGRQRWDLNAEEGQFMNPGPEADFRFKGRDNFGQIDTEIQLGRLIALDFSYLYSNTEFGNIKSYNAGVQFEF